LQSSHAELFMSGTILLDGRINQESDLESFPENSEILRYTLNLRLASNSELHQDLLFYEMQLDSLERDNANDGKGEHAGVLKMIIAKIRAVEEEISRRRMSSD
jgi:hypothetical protein